MKLAMLQGKTEASARPAVVLPGGQIVWFEQLLGSRAPASIDQMVSEDALGWLRDLSRALSSKTWTGQDLGDLGFNSPISLRRNPFCIGRNYPEHAQEAVRSGVAKSVNQEFPIFFTKATTSLNRHGGEITAFQTALDLDYEAELGVVLGSKGRGVARDQAESMIFGYTLVNDVTARAVQQRHQQWFLGKSFDGFCPVGPVLVTRDEVTWPVALTLRLRVNGELRQHFNTRDMMFDVADQIAWLSQGMTLLPGDLIATGTGDGVGRSFSPPRYLSPGDVVEVECVEIGRLSNRIIAET